jgi:hypothetical protein
MFHLDQPGIIRGSNWVYKHRMVQFSSGFQWPWYSSDPGNQRRAGVGRYLFSRLGETIYRIRR